MRKQKTGTDLDLSIMSQCVRLLNKVPPASRVAILQWLHQRLSVPEEAPQKQPELFE